MKTFADPCSTGFPGKSSSAHRCLTEGRGGSEKKKREWLDLSILMPALSTTVFRIVHMSPNKLSIRNLPYHDWIRHSYNNISLFHWAAGLSKLLKRFTLYSQFTFVCLLEEKQLI